MTIVMILLAAVVVTAFVTRRLVRREVERQMWAESETAGDASEAAPAAEVKAPRELQFTPVDAESELPEAAAMRERLIGLARGRSRVEMGYDILGGVAFLILGLLGGAYVGFAGLTLVFFGAVRYVAFRGQFRAYQPGIAGVARPFLYEWLTLADPKYRAWIIAAVVIAALYSAVTALLIPYGGGWKSALLLVAAAAVLVGTTQRQMALVNRAPNLKLLVLRVFGIDRQAHFTFDGVLAYWRHFGSHFIVVDPTLVKARQSVDTWIFPASIGLMLLVFASFDFADLVEKIGSQLVAQPWIVAVAATPVAVLYAWASLRKVRRDFIASRADLLNRLSALEARPATPNLTFRSLPMMCHANVWKSAVAECMRICDVVMMDLRGFTSERKGCEYEVDYLFDVLPLDRIVFLADPEGVEQVLNLLRERWAYLRSSSPNIGNEAPAVRVYVTTNENNRDVQGILDILLDTGAARPWDADSSAETVANHFCPE